MKSQANAIMVGAKLAIGPQRQFILVISVFLLHFKAHYRGHWTNTQPDTGKLCAEFYAITYSPVSLMVLLVG